MRISSVFSSVLPHNKKSRRYFNESIADASGNTNMIGLWLNISSSEIIGNWFLLHVAAVRLGMVPSTFDNEKYLQETVENPPNMDDWEQYANRKIIIDCWRAIAFSTLFGKSTMNDWMLSRKIRIHRCKPWPMTERIW